MFAEGEENDDEWALLTPLNLPSHVADYTRSRRLASV
jgi:hypothetical protein